MQLFLFRVCRNNFISYDNLCISLDLNFLLFAGVASQLGCVDVDAVTLEDMGLEVYLYIFKTECIIVIVLKLRKELTNRILSTLS